MMLIHRAATDAYSSRRKEPYVIEQRIRQCVVKECAITPKSHDHRPSSVNVVALVDGIHTTQHANFRQVPAMRDTISVYHRRRDIKIKQKKSVHNEKRIGEMHSLETFIIASQTLSRNRYGHPFTFKQIQKKQVTFLILSTILYHAAIGQESERTNERCLPI